MSSVIRLDAIPITNLPQLVKSDAVEPYSTKVNCVLRCDQLPTYQHLEVSVNGVLQQSVREQEQTVFSWQFVKASDEVRIRMLSRGEIKKYWQGCWNERDAILHLGTLPIQVFFNGKQQPLVMAVGGITSAATLAAMHSATEEASGNGHVAVLSELENGEHKSSEQQKNGEPIIVQNLLVIAEPQPSSTPSLLNDSKIEDQGKGDESYELEGDEQDEVEEDESYEMEENGLVRKKDGELFVLQGSSQAVDEFTAEPHLAAFYADPLAYNEALEALKDLLATMPPKTIIIDLRRHSQTKKRNQGYSGLSKERLRATFGGKYWDRGWAIQTTYQSDSSSDKHFSRWRLILVDPDRHPDGILSFVEYLQAGYSMVVMDGAASYVESSRRAVIEELQKRLPNLHLIVGPIE